MVPLEKVTASDARNTFSELISSVKYGRRRVCITSNGKDMAAMIPLQDLEVLEALLRRYEDEVDSRDAKIALEEAEREGTVSLDELIADLGL
jgi:prevent-host-death family protein